jgi:aspartate racemase
MRIPNKKIGIIGGIGPQATEFIYRKISEFSQTKYGAKNNDDYPYSVIESVPIPDFISNKKKLETAKIMLFDTIKNLEKAGATRLAITSNTVHILLPELKSKTKLGFLSIIEIVALEMAQRKYKKVALLGTPVLIRSGIYEKELSRYGIGLILPDDREQKISEEIIRGVLAGRHNGAIKKKYIQLLNEMFEKGAEAIILGCTELPLAMNYEAFGDKTINSDELLAEAISDYYYKKEYE